MKNTIDLLKGLLEVIDFEFPILLSFEEGVWYIKDNTIYWNSDGIAGDLLNEEGNTFSGYMPEGSIEKDGYLITNLDTQTGTWQTSIFPIENKINPNLNIEYRGRLYNGH